MPSKMCSSAAHSDVLKDLITANTAVVHPRSAAVQGAHLPLACCHWACLKIVLAVDPGT